MTKRPWAPVALILVLLIGVTLIVGTQVRARLTGAEDALAPFLSEEPPSVLGDPVALADAACGDPRVVEEGLRSFYDAVDADRIDDEAEGRSPVDMVITDPSFDSFLLRSAIARLTVDDRRLLLRTRHQSGVWCLADAEFSTEE